MTVHAQAAVGLAGPSPSRIASLRRIGLLTFGGLILAAATGIAEIVFLGRWLVEIPQLGVIGALLGLFFVAHVLCRALVYNDAGAVGFIGACVCEGLALGILLLSTIVAFGVHAGLAVVLEAFGLTVATGGGLLAYVWFNKSEFSRLRSFLYMVSVPMLVMMVVSTVIPIGGTPGLVLAGIFTVVSALALLHRLNFVVHELEPHQQIEGAYEITMGLLILFWNILSFLHRLRR